VGTLTAGATQGAGATLAGVGTLTAFGSTPAPAVVNQWANSYGQGTTFGDLTPALQSDVVPLTPAFSVGAGSGTPSAGNWLFAIASWTQDAGDVHVGTSDDIHSWWRQFPASGAGGLVRTAVAYTPNLARSPQYVYTAPDGAVAAVNVLVIEVSGLGPWDTLIGTGINYAAAATSLSLSQNASAASTFFIAGVGGDNTSSGQAFAPSGWTTLATQTQTNGTDHTADNILTSAVRFSTTSNQSVSATASAEDMSGFILAVKVNGDSPIPAAQNPAWPFTLFEAALGAGYNTPASELTWTGLTSRLWSWDETTGIQYQLGQVQATELNLEIDNFDGALTPAGAAWSFTAHGTPSAHNFFTVTTAQAASISAGDGFTDTTNTGTLFTVTGIGSPSGGFVNVTFTPSAGSVMASPDVVSQAALSAGTPVRLRAAIGTLGGSSVNRWYVIARNAHEWEEQVNANYRKWCPVSGTDVWAAMSSSPPTFYRSEVYQDSPQSWWPLDDPPGIAGTLPVTMLNAAVGNTNVMDVVVSPNGTGPENPYGTDGTLLNSIFAAPELNPSLAVYTVAAAQGWMFGDPPAEAASLATGNEVTPNPGSAAWQTTGQLGNTGSFGWFLSARDASFPPLSGGITAGAWFNYQFLGSQQVVEAITQHIQAQQPYCPLTLMTLATDTHPVAVLQMDVAGHLSLITYSGSTGTSHSVYSAADLRTQAWFHVMITATTTTWTVWVNGGATAKVSGTAAGMTSAWTYLIVNGDMGTSGGTSPGSIAHSGNGSFSHVQVFPAILPYWRIQSHYWAAVTGFGQMPAPQAVALQALHSSQAGPTVTPDGQFVNASGGYGESSGGFSGQTVYTMSGVVEAVVAGYHSGPSAYGTTTGIPQYNSPGLGDNIGISWTGVAASFAIYNSTSVGNEAQATTTIATSDTFKSGYGAGTNAFGIGDTGGGSGASAPAASQIGDSAGQRIERLMLAGKTASPQRSVDPDAELVQAPGASGTGQQMSTSVQAIQQSTSGMLFVDNQGNLTYWSRSHLASQYSSPVWTLTPDAPPTPGAPLTAIPYYKEYRIVSDPQRIFNTITIQPFAPNGEQLPLITPTDATDVNASQSRYGAQQFPVTSWLQSQVSMQSQANWLFTNFGQPQVRAENIRVDAAPYPAAFEMVLGVNVGDLITLEEWQVGGGGQVLTLRVTQINRKIRFGGQDAQDSGEGTVVASVEIIADWEPPAYF
jgi:hypothetical protein